MDDEHTMTTSVMMLSASRPLTYRVKCSCGWSNDYDSKYLSTVGRREHLEEIEGHLFAPETSDADKLLDSMLDVEYSTLLALPKSARNKPQTPEAYPMVKVI